jgi:predicted ATP-binding protein involved in virulence
MRPHLCKKWGHWRKRIRSLKLPEKSETNRITEDGSYSSPFGKAPLAELSEGYRSTLAWVGHLLVHILSTVGWSEDLDQVSGLVLFDELDLHLHPKWRTHILSLGHFGDDDGDGEG